MSSSWMHGGDLRALAAESGLDERDLLDFSANLNPLGPPDWLRAVVATTLDRIEHYPDPHATLLRNAAAARYGVDASEVIAGNGSAELLHSLLPLFNARRAIIAVPSYVDYANEARGSGLEVVELPLCADTNFALDFSALECLIDSSYEPAVVLLGTPNNPTGRTVDIDAVRALAARHPHTWFVIDEAFADFVANADRMTAPRPSNVVVLLSLTKAYAIAGLRLGLAIADETLIARWRSALPPWSVNSIAQSVGIAALNDVDYLQRTREACAHWREELFHALNTIDGIRAFAGEANFLLARIDTATHNASSLRRALLKHGIAIRDCANFAALDARYFRVAVRTAQQNARLVAALRDELHLAPAIHIARSTPAVMFQGTSSNAGKSVLTAALCRILLEDGFNVAPFKAQNMSLNSYVTADGREMGRAQVVQAQAARRAPDVRMNPILLKPNSDTGSQVILNGRAIGNMDALDYFAYKRDAAATALRAYDELARECDCIVLEGAGSPAEVNLKRYDIVNMAMAAHAGAPVLLVGDIDRGGVFASFIGSMEVFSPSERALVAGFVVNRFRGRKDLLGDASDIVERHTGKRVVGVVPYLPDLGLPEEDSVGFKEGRFDDTSALGTRLDVAVVDLPHISNFTDLDALRAEPALRVRRVVSPNELGTPDVVLLPGSKNVPGDIRALRDAGLLDALQTLAQNATCEIVGICGGYQILGRAIADPHSIEGSTASIDALALLDIETTLERTKTLRRTTAHHVESGLTVTGYEIHHGQTSTAATAPAFINDDGMCAGSRSVNGLVWGSYLHGLFDNDAFRHWWIRRALARTARPYDGAFATYDLEPAFTRLAAVVRDALPIDWIYRAMRLK